jgi:hypothetical protein
MVQTASMTQGCDETGSRRNVAAKVFAVAEALEGMGLASHRRTGNILVFG